MNTNNIRIGSKLKKVIHINNWEDEEKKKEEQCNTNSEEEK